MKHFLCRHRLYSLLNFLIICIVVLGMQSLPAMAQITFHAWGNNQYGQLGDGTNTDRVFNVSTTDASDTVTIAAGSFHTLALKTDGTVWAWGNNQAGQLGSGTFSNSTIPVRSIGISGIAAISGGQSHSLALKSDGTVWAWGANDYGQLGDGTGATQGRPVLLPNLTDVAAIAAGSDHSIIIREGQRTGSVSGTLTMQGIASGAASQVVTFLFTPASGNPITKTATVTPSGTYSLSSLPPNSYTVRIKGAKYLAQSLPVTITAGGTATLNATLRVGDANNDNAADIADLLLLITHYNQVTPNAGYLESADFNGDGANDISDLLLLIRNYNQVGR